MPCPPTSVVAAVRTTALPSGMVTLFRRACPVPSMSAVPRAAVPTVKLTVPEDGDARDTHADSQIPASRQSYRRHREPQVPDVEPAAHSVLVDIGVTKVTMGGVPTVTEQGDISEPALPATSVPVAVTGRRPAGGLLR